MIKILLLAIIWNTQTGEIDQAALKGYETLEACERDRVKFAEANESRVMQMFTRCVSPTEKST